MKRDLDLVRDILLWMENQQQSQWHLSDFPILQNDRQKTIGHIILLRDAGYLETSERGSYRMSWEGHEFLDKVRDSEIWNKTKDGASKLNSWSVKLLGELASGFIKAKAAELGLPI